MRRPTMLRLLIGCVIFALPLPLFARNASSRKLYKPPKVLSSQLRTKHFHIYTDLDPASLDYYKQVMEGFFEYFDKNYFQIRQRRPLLVYLFKDATSYKPYVKGLREQYTPYGFYAGLKANVIVVNRASGLGTMTHELVHHFIATSFAKRPPGWANEGIAAFFEKFIGHLDQHGKLTISFGYFSNWRFPITKKNLDKLSLKVLIRSENADQCAARSLMLFLHKKGLFDDFVNRLRVQTRDPTAAISLQRVYRKPLPAIEREWKSWIKSQPLDADVDLVKWAFIKTDQEWKEWWAENKEKLYWSDAEQIYRVRQNTSATIFPIVPELGTKNAGTRDWPIKSLLSVQHHPAAHVILADPERFAQRPHLFQKDQRAVARPASRFPEIIFGHYPPVILLPYHLQLFTTLNSPANNLPRSGHPPHRPRRFLQVYSLALFHHPERRLGRPRQPALDGLFPRQD